MLQPRRAPVPRKDFRSANTTKFNVATGDTGRVRPATGFEEIKAVSWQIVSRVWRPLDQVVRHALQ